MTIENTVVSQMNWGQVITIIASMLISMGGFFLWVRKDLKEDNITLRNDMKDGFKILGDKLDNIRDRVGRVEGQEDFSRSAILELWKRDRKDGGAP